MLASGRSESAHSSGSERTASSAIDGSANDHPVRPPGFYETVKQRFAEERDRRLELHPEGVAQFTSDLVGEFARFDQDPYAPPPPPREPLTDSVEVLIIGAGFSALLASVGLRAQGVERIRMVERGADVAGTWYWNRYPGVACDVVSYDYLPLLDEMGYVPSRHYAPGEEIFRHCQAIARKYGLYDSALFQTTVTEAAWQPDEGMWLVRTDCGDAIKARFLIAATGTLTKPKLARIKGMERFRGHSFHTSRWDYDYTGESLEKLSDKVVGVIGTGASAVQIIPNLATTAKEVYVFQRTPSSIDIRPDFETDPVWAASLKPGWQAARRAKALKQPPFGVLPIDEARTMTKEERRQKEEEANIEYMMRIHQRIDEVVVDRATAEALKPWYMYMCKRPCFHNEYLPTFNRPNVHLVDTQGRGITEISKRGPVFDGRDYPVDLLIYATGFDFFKVGPRHAVFGAGAVELKEKYADGVRTLFGVHSHGYPNLFIMGGLQASFQFNMSFALQVQAEHIAGCIGLVLGRGANTIEATADAEDWWVREVISCEGAVLNNPDCTPGYYNDYGRPRFRQDRTYDGGFPNYIDYLETSRTSPDRYFDIR